MRPSERPDRTVVITAFTAAALTPLVTSGAALLLDVREPTVAAVTAVPLVALIIGLLRGIVVLHRQLAARSSEVAQLSDQLRELARRDSLTGLLNRRAFEELASPELAKDDGEYRSLVFFDLDGFELCNERLGREEGDRILVGFGEALRRNVRPEDVVARIGGDEFVVLLRHSDSAAAQRVVHRLDDRLRGLIDVSAGIATTNRPAELEALLRQADLQMCEAKRSGQSCKAVFVRPEQSAEPAFA